MLVADSGNHRILRVRPGGQTEVIAGTGRRGFGGDGGPAARALLSSPTQVSITPDGALLIADTGNGAIRRVAPDGSMSTLARGLRQPSGVAVLPAGSALPQGTVIATTASAVVTIAPGGQTTRRAGRATSGFNRDNGPASSVLLKRAGQISVGSAGRIFFADRGNDRVRELTRRPVSASALTARTTAGGNGDKPISTPSTGKPGKRPAQMLGADDNGNCLEEFGGFDPFYLHPLERIKGKPVLKNPRLSVRIGQPALVVVEVFKGSRRLRSQPERVTSATRRLRRLTLDPGTYRVKLWGRSTRGSYLRCTIRTLKVKG